MAKLYERQAKQMSLSILVPRAKSSPARVLEVKQWVRDHFYLSDDVTVMVTELQCSEPGCPPLETVIAIMGAENSKIQYKLHKSLAEITRADVEGLRAGELLVSDGNAESSR
jgi:hypothetical protein